MVSIGGLREIQISLNKNTISSDSSHLANILVYLCPTQSHNWPYPYNFTRKSQVFNVSGTQHGGTESFSENLRFQYKETKNFISGK